MTGAEKSHNGEYEASPSARKPRRDRTPDHMFSGRYCERCGKELTRLSWGGSLEALSAYQRRRFCPAP